MRIKRNDYQLIAKKIKIALANGERQIHTDMSYDSLKEGQKVFFKGEGIPMELISRNERYAVVVRSLDIEEDYDLIYFQVERGAYYDTKEAFEDIKSDPIYSLLDFEKEQKAPSNLIFNPYDYFSKTDCNQAITDLQEGEHELSRRHGVDLNIDWDRTNKVLVSE